MSQLRDLNSNVSKNFKYGEFVASKIAKKYQIPIIPTEEQWFNIENLVHNILQPVADQFGSIRINSGIRTPEITLAARNLAKYEFLKKNNPKELERLIKETTSYHDYGFAADIEPLNPNIPLLDVLEFIAKNLPFSQLIAEFFPDGWVHVAYWTGEQVTPKGLILLKDSTNNYSKVSLSQLIQKYRR